MHENLANLFHKKINQIFTEGLGIPRDPRRWPNSWKRVEFKEYPRLKQVPLPKHESLQTSLSTILEKRNSSRMFSSNHSMTLTSLSTLLYYSVGTNNQRGADLNAKKVRHYPSGGALYPLEVYLYIQDVPDIIQGLYHYNVKKHTLERIDNYQCKPTIDRAIHDWARPAQITLFITSVWKRNFQKYHEYGYPIVLLEAGHLAQNIQLVAESLGCNYCSYVGFNADALDEVLDIKKQNEENILYITSIGGKSSEN